VSTDDVRSARELLAALADMGAAGAKLADPELERQRIYRELAEHDDPLLQEIGQLLRDGVIRPHQLLEMPSYQEAVADRLEALGQLDLDSARRELIAYLRDEEAEP
jgi:hypothetical protein